MTGLTEHQLCLLEYIERFMAESGGIAPTFTQMMVAMSLLSKSGVHRLLSALEERGMIRRLPGRARAIEIIDQQPDLTAVPVQALLAELARRGLHPHLPGSTTTAPGSTLPGPLPEPPVPSGSGPSEHRFHASEVSHV
ncbi:LexA family protein [Novosphingobium gossypii]|uniref:LexA family protein n=1 Tax=Novosphingobium gossypii TaxID=1604774 RepID=UPI003D260283